VLVVGDVVGRGVQAAAVMGQLQATVRAYALDGYSPAAVLTRLDRVVHSVPDLHFTTCVVARLEPATGALLLCSAGHLPPVVADAQGGARLLEVEPVRPLGVGGGRYVDQELALPDDAILMLYTDGLVEERDASLTEGLDRLVAALTTPVRSADEACAQVLCALGRDAGTDDDTAVLAVHRCGAAMLEVRLPRTGPSARVARRGVRSVAAAHGLDGGVAELLVSELVGNAVRHGGGGDDVDAVVLRVTVDGDALRVELDDCSEHLPEVPQAPGHGAESGRGLLLVADMATRWGAHALGGGKRMWFEVACEPAQGRQAQGSQAQGDSGSAHQLEHRHARRLEAQHLTVEGELGLQGGDDRGGLAEAVGLALERQVGVRDARALERSQEQLGLRRRHDRVVQPLQQQDRAVEPVDVGQRGPRVVDGAGLGQRPDQAVQVARLEVVGVLRHRHEVGDAEVRRPGSEDAVASGEGRQHRPPARAAAADRDGGGASGVEQPPGDGLAVLDLDDAPLPA
jgi:anti-sigma regulatory factor (Ser/Thr protein kinase)